MQFFSRKHYYRRYFEEEAASPGRTFSGLRQAPLWFSFNRETCWRWGGEMAENGHQLTNAVKKVSREIQPCDSAESPDVQNMYVLRTINLSRLRLTLRGYCLNLLLL